MVGGRAGRWEGGGVSCSASACAWLCFRFKLLKWWAQSFLVGVPKIVCGFRDDDGIVKNLQHFKTTSLAHDTQVGVAMVWLGFARDLSVLQNDLSLWQPAVCLNFLDELLSWIRTVVTKDGPRWVC